MIIMIISIIRYIVTRHTEEIIHIPTGLGTKYDDTNFRGDMQPLLADNKLCKMTRTTQCYTTIGRRHGEWLLRLRQRQLDDIPWSVHIVLICFVLLLSYSEYFLDSKCIPVPVK